MGEYVAKFLFVVVFIFVVIIISLEVIAPFNESRLERLESKIERYNGYIDSKRKIVEINNLSTEELVFKRPELENLWIREYIIGVDKASNEYNNLPSNNITVWLNQDNKIEYTIG